MDIKNLEKELIALKDEIVLLEVSSEQAIEASSRALKCLTENGKIGIIVSASRPYSSLLDLYKKYNINSRNLMIIDAITHNQGLKTDVIGIDNIFFVENVRSLTTISIMIRECIRKITKSKFVFIDSITSMLIYNKPDIYMRFLHGALSEMRNESVGGILIFVENEGDEKFKSQLKTICDKVIKID